MTYGETFHDDILRARADLDTIGGSTDGLDHVTDLDKEMRPGQSYTPPTDRHRERWASRVQYPTTTHKRIVWAIYREIERANNG